MSQPHPDAGAVTLPIDAIVAGIDPLLGHLEARGLLPRRRPPGATTRPIPQGNPAIFTATSVPNRLLGFSFRAVGGAAAIELRDGVDETGDLLYPVNLNPNETVREWFGPEGIQLATGLVYVLVSGAVDGAAFIGEI